MTKLHGKQANLTLTEISESKLTFKVDPPDALSVTWQPPEYECPVHGNVKQAYIANYLGAEMVGKPRCLRCFDEKLGAIGVCEVTEIKK